MLTQTGLYALQALLHLAEQDGGAYVPAAAMATALGVPGTYLAKVLQRLGREGLVEASRGARGGYRLLADPAVVSVADAVAPFQELRSSQTCLLGGPCDPARPCNAHARRVAWSIAAHSILEQTTLADLLSGAPLEELSSTSTPVTETSR